MKVTINNEPIILDYDGVTLEELRKLRNIPEAGTAIAVNGRVVRAGERESFLIKEGDCIVVISAAYGG